MPPLMRVGRAFPLRRPLSWVHRFVRFLARRLVAGGGLGLSPTWGSTWGSNSAQLALLVVDEALLDVEQAWTSVFYLKSFDMDSVQVGKAVFGKEIYTTLGIEPRTYSNLGRSGIHSSVCWVKNWNVKQKINASSWNVLGWKIGTAVFFKQAVFITSN